MVFDFDLTKGRLGLIILVEETTALCRSVYVQKGKNMKINMETDYAFRIMRCLAQRNAVTDARTVSEITEVPQRFTLKILGKLVGGGIVTSYKGANGG